MSLVLVVGCNLLSLVRLVEIGLSRWFGLVFWKVFWLVCWITLLGRCVRFVCLVGVFLGVVVGFYNGANFSLP